MGFKIERNIPPPPKWGRRTGVSEALRSLKVGESVVLPLKNAALYSLAIRILGKGNYTAREVDSGHHRIWRTK